MSKNLYALLVCFWTAFGIGQSAVAAFVAQSWTLNWLFFIAVLVISIVGIIIAMLALGFALKPSITGLAGAPVTGCCDTICQETGASSCAGGFYPGSGCNAVPACEVGCCVDGEGYCLGNYLQSNCVRRGGNFVQSSECADTLLCLVEKTSADLVGATGYTPRLRAGEHAVAVAMPAAGRRGCPATGSPARGPAP